MPLPYLTEEIKGIKGNIKSSSSDFIVIEELSYAPINTGEHLFIKITKEDLNTNDVLRMLKKLFNVHEKSIGTAGMKDKNAVTTQTFSVAVGRNFELEKAKEILESTDEFKTHEISKHENKLKTGHLLGNHFKIRIRDCEMNEESVQMIYQKVKTGIPNFYGEQRFGSKGDNWEKGLEFLRGTRKGKHKVKKLMLSALQSKLFNEILAKRLERNLLFTELPGDVVISGSITAPMFGEKSLIPSLESLELEEEVLKQYELTREEFNIRDLPGASRPILVVPQNLSYKIDQNDLLLSFFLPKGSYATTLIREFSKT